MRIPFFSNLFGGKVQETHNEIDPLRAATSIPINQPSGNPPSLEVIKEVSATEHIEPEWRKKYRGFDLKQIGYSNLPEGGAERLRIEFSAYRNIQENFSLKDDVFGEEYIEPRQGYVQDDILVYNQATKAEGGKLLSSVLSATSIHKTEIQAGQIQQANTPKRTGLGSILQR